MSWRHVVVEAFCFAEEDHIYPCGKSRISSVCFGADGKCCPNFGFTDSTEREAAYWVPLHLVVWDKLKVLPDKAYWKLRWLLWDQFNRNNDKFFDDIDVIQPGEYPEMDAEDRNRRKRFRRWIKKNEYKVGAEGSEAPIKEE
jgi:hypothetical protein